MPILIPILIPILMSIFVLRIIVSDFVRFILASLFRRGDTSEAWSPVVRARAL